MREAPAPELTIRGGTVLTPQGLRPAWGVAVAGGQIVAVGPGLSGAGQEVDASGLYVLPGFVDVHVHGAFGSSDPVEMARSLPRTGVTSFLPTLAAASTEDTLAFVETVADCSLEDGAGEVLGSHLEGPFLNSDRRGAQPAQHLRRPDLGEIERLLDAGRGTLRRMTIAPEMRGARSVMRRLIEAGVQVSLGHSSCSYEQALEAVDWGATSVTHIYNAMAAFHHRQPGLLGAALTVPDLLAELIADGVHVHTAAALALIRARGPGAVAAVTDGLPALGLPPGTYDWSGRPVVSDGAACRLEDGRLAGSVTPMDQALRNLVAWGVPLEDAAIMASRGGATLAGAAHRKGAIAPGFNADLVLLNAELQVTASSCRGRLARTDSSLLRGHAR